MKAAIFHGPHEPLTIEQVDIDKPGPREVLVRTVASGVCHSDLHFVDGLYPYPAPAVLGHEAAGIVEAVGDQVTYVQPGDHVIACLSVFCGHCDMCVTGRTHLCRNPELRRAPNEKPRLSQGGTPVHQFLNISSYAERMLLHEHAIVKIRDDMPLDRAALIGCGVMTGVGAVLNTAKVPAGSTVAVFGAGGVGLSAIQGARIAGAGKIIAVDMMENKLATAKQLGATHIVDASSHDPVQAIREITGGGVEYSFEAIGNAKVAAAGVRRARARRYGDDHRHDPGRPEGRDRRAFAAVREDAAGLHDGVEPLPRRHAALHRLLHGRAAEARRDDHEQGHARRRQRCLPRDEGRRGRAHGADARRGVKARDGAAPPVSGAQDHSEEV